MLLSLLNGPGTPAMQYLLCSNSLAAAAAAAAACVVTSRLAGQHAGAVASCQFYSNSSSNSSSGAVAGEEAQPSSSGTEAAAAQSKPRGPVHAPHLGLDDTEFDIVLRYNTDFTTDPDRTYALGHTRAFERVTKQELRKALAAQRLHLKDAAAAYAAGPAGSKQPPMRDLMLRRLSDMQEAVISR